MIKVRTLLKYLLAACLLNQSSILFAAPQNIKIAKGQVVDILMLTNKEDINELRNQYFRDIYPPAKELGYNPAAGFRIIKKPISGYYSPDVLAIGSWPGDWEQRKKHFEALQAARPDIRSRRLDVWSTFNMMNFEVKEDIKVAFDPTKSYVFGAYWLNDEKDSRGIQKALMEAIKTAGGHVELASDELTTMFGYPEAPALVLITRWDSQSAFEAFNSKNGAATNSHINRSSEMFLHIKSD